MGFPGVFLSGVASPFYQVLHSLTNILHVKDVFNFIFKMVVINGGRGRWRLGLGREGWSIVQSEENFVEHGVYSPSMGEVEVISSRSSFLFG